MRKDIHDAFKALMDSDDKIFVAQVVDVDKDNGICTVVADELEYTEVRLSAIVKERESVYYLFPVVGSFVLVAPINGDVHNLVVVSYSEVEELKFTTGQSELNITPDGFLLRKQNENLQKLMLDLIKAIKRMKFTTNTGSTIKLINTPEFTALEPRIKNLLKDN